MTPRSDLDPDKLKKALPTVWLGRQFLTFLDETTSTNSVLLGDLTAPHGAVLAADHQTAGRGRGDRIWHNQAGKDLLFSILLLPEVPLVRFPSLTLAAGLAAYDLVCQAGAADVSLKWPNDVLIAGKKVCGILCQTITAPRPRVVVGIGLNVNSRARERPAILHNSAISLLEACNRSFARGDLLAGYLALFENHYATWRDRFSETLATWEKRAGLIGKTIKIINGPETITALVTGFDADGHPLVVVDGRSRAVAGGEILLLEERP